MWPVWTQRFFGLIPKRITVTRKPVKNPTLLAYAGGGVYSGCNFDGLPSCIFVIHNQVRWDVSEVDRVREF